MKKKRNKSLHMSKTPDTWFCMQAYLMMYGSYIMMYQVDDVIWYTNTHHDVSDAGCHLLYIHMLWSPLPYTSWCMVHTSWRTHVYQMTSFTWYVMMYKVYITRYACIPNHVSGIFGPLVCVTFQTFFPGFSLFRDLQT